MLPILSDFLMRFLKTLQRAQVERPEKPDGAAGKTAVNGSSSGPQGILANEDLKIGMPELRPAALENGSRARHESGMAPKLELAVVPPVAVEEKFLEFAIDPDRINKRLVAITQPQSAYTEEYRSLRTHVLHACRKRDLKTIVILSCGSSEGKSITAVNLAWLLAQTDGVKALVIDSDMRLASIDEYLGIEARFGLSDVLDGKVSLRDAIVRIAPAGLHVLPAGDQRFDVAEMISGPTFKSILEEARGMFDCVIIDAPPLGLFSDAAELVNQADGALFVVRSNRVNYGDIGRILNSVPKERIIGAVLNCAENEPLKKDYYNYSYYKKY